MPRPNAAGAVVWRPSRRAVAWLVLALSLVGIGSETCPGASAKAAPPSRASTNTTCTHHENGVTVRDVRLESGGHRPETVALLSGAVLICGLVVIAQRRRAR